jgi:hypothetical protein
LREELRRVYDRTSVNVNSVKDWDTDEAVGGALAIVGHTAYHLGAIRQILTVVNT